MIELVLYHRHGCHLCDDMLAALQRLQDRGRFRLRVVDVDGDDNLKRRYDDKVPVLETAGTELCRYRLDERKLSEMLKIEGKFS